MKYQLIPWSWKSVDSTSARDAKPGTKDELYTSTFATHTRESAEGQEQRLALAAAHHPFEHYLIPGIS
jgi:hypothetical protein